MLQSPAAVIYEHKAMLNHQVYAKHKQMHANTCTKHGLPTSCIHHVLVVYYAQPSKPGQSCYLTHHTAPSINVYSVYMMSIFTR